MAVMTAAVPPGYRTVDVPEARFEEFLEVDHTAFAFEMPLAERDLVPFAIPDGRMRAVEGADGRLAAVHGSYEFTMPVPGGATVPTSGLTWVGVRPDHRRRGLLSAMITDHFERSLARSEPVSALFAAEAAIYGRFGYGCAADDLRLKLARGTALRPVAGSAELTVSFERVDPAVHAELVDTIHRAAGEGRPGWMTRDTDKHQLRALADPPSWREGGEALRIAVARDAAGDPRGYALLRRKEKWDEAGPAGTVELRDVSALDAAATHRLWTFLLDLDLMSTVKSPMLAVDDPLLHLLVNQRHARPQVTDNLWVRLLDLPVALAARRYAAPLDAVLDVTDAWLPANAGRWRLTTGDVAADGTATAAVERTSDPADLTLDVRELGAAYLGGRSLAALAAASLVSARSPEVLQAASTAFGWSRAPLCSWVF
jgi:predicted acetyltransferase